MKLSRSAVQKRDVIYGNPRIEESFKIRTKQKKLSYKLSVENNICSFEGKMNAEWYLIVNGVFRIQLKKVFSEGQTNNERITGHSVLSKKLCSVNAKKFACHLALCIFLTKAVINHD